MGACSPKTDVRRVDSNALMRKFVFLHDCRFPGRAESRHQALQTECLLRAKSGRVRATATPAPDVQQVFSSCFICLSNLQQAFHRQERARYCSKEVTSKARRSKRVFSFQGRVLFNLILSYRSGDLSRPRLIADHAHTPAGRCLAATVGATTCSRLSSLNWINRVAQ